MAAKKLKMDANVSVDLSDQVKEARSLYQRLRAELEAERKTVRQLRRDKSYEVQQARDQEQHRATVALNDLRTKLHQERLADLEDLKTSLMRRCETDLQRAMRQKDAHIQRLERDLLKCQEQMSNNTNSQRGLSTSARGAFESERISKLLEEVKQLKSEKKSAEEAASKAAEAERKMAQEMLRLKEKHKAEMNKALKDADSEIKRLVSQMK